MGKKTILICIALLCLLTSCTQNMSSIEPASSPTQNIVPSAASPSPSISELITPKDDDIDPAIENYDWASHPFYANMEPERKKWVISNISGHEYTPSFSDDPMAICNLFPDPFFARKISRIFDKETNDIVTFEELSSYTGVLDVHPGPYCDLTGIGYLTNIQGLDFAINCIAEIPDEIENCENLKFIRVLKAFDLVVVSPKIGSLKKLEYFDAGLSSLAVLPKEIGNAESLKFLRLGHTDIVKLPKEIGNLTNLVYLDIGSTGITEIPDSICNLKNLRYLNIGHNNIAKLPKNIGNLVSLETFMLFGCNLKKLPDSMKKLEKLSVLNVYDNFNLDESYKKYISEDVYTCKNPGVSREIYQEFWDFMDSFPE